MGLPKTNEICDLKPMRHRLDLVQVALFQPISITLLVIFRVFFGLLLAWEMFRYYKNGWIYEIYIRPQFHFTYPGFDWVSPPPGDGMNWVFFGVGVCAVCISLGILYRLAAILFTVGFTYIFLCESSHYLNHFYLIILLGGILSVVSPHRWLSVDSMLFPSIKSKHVPAWQLYLLKFQIAIPYTFGGLVKIQSDWLLRAEPLRMWMEGRIATNAVGEWISSEWAVYTMAWGGMLFDLLIVPCLLWKRTRLFAIVSAILFHMLNANLFHIGVFPLLMIAALVLFLEPNTLSRSKSSAPEPVMVRTSVTISLACYTLFQVLFPLRHFLYPGDVNWTDEGKYFSWRMKLTQKQGGVHFYTINPQNNKLAPIVIRDILTKKQLHYLLGRPDSIHEFARYLSVNVNPGKRYPVFVKAQASMNRGPTFDLIDPMVNLASKTRRIISPSPWIRFRNHAKQKKQGEAG